MKSVGEKKLHFRNGRGGGGVPKNEEKSMRLSGCREKGKIPSAGGGKPGTVDEDVSNSQSCVATVTHQSRPRDM